MQAIACKNKRDGAEMKLEGAIFDADGTLLDSMSIWDTAGSEYLLSLGIIPEANLAQVVEQMSLSQAAVYLQSVYGVDKSVDAIIAGINAVVRDFYLEKVQLLPGVKDFLDILSDMDVKMIVATVSDKALIQKALERCGIDKYFAGVLSCEEIGVGKDNPQIYHTALEILGTEKENTVVFEDAPYAIKTAEEAGFMTRQVGGNAFCYLTKAIQERGGIG